MHTTSTAGRRATATAVFVGATLLAAAPAYALVAPDRLAERTSTAQQPTHPTKAQVEHDEHTTAPPLRPRSR